MAFDSVRFSAYWIIDLDDLICMDTVISVGFSSPVWRWQVGRGRTLRI
ncbi:hypothetical protein HMPREF9148_00332 [Prevotella sp. F0091]|nr:hypothetical protein HMPREF9148_00332 [Prevotella sp. F0091]